MSPLENCNGGKKKQVLSLNENIQCDLSKERKFHQD